MPQNEARTLRQKITGVLVRQARLDAGKTLKECGQVLGLSSDMVSAIEHGRRAISLPELELIAYYLGTPLGRLLNGSAESTRRSIDDLPSDEIITLRHRIVGALLRQARLEKGLSEQELAQNVGLSASQLSEYELGRAPIPLVELETLAAVLALPLDHFLDAGIGPLGEQQRLDREWGQFVELPQDVRKFVLDPTNLGYLQVAMSLSVVPAEGLRNIAASLLDITL